MLRDRIICMKTSIFSRGLSVLAALLCSTGAHADQDKPGCKYVQLAELPLYYKGSGLQVMTRGVVDGKPARMLVDTGAFTNALSRTLTDRLDLPLNMTGQYAEGIGGFSRIYSARVSQFAIGPSRAGKGWIRVLGDTGSAAEYDAIAGAPFLLQTDMELSLAEKKMRFFHGMDCEKSYLGYWKGEIFDIPFEYHRDRSPNPHFTIEVNGVKLDAMIDTGATVTSIMAGAARKAGLKLDAPGTARLGDATGIGSDRVASWSTIVDSMRIGGELVRDAHIAVLDGADISTDVLLGDDYLRSHRVLFAMSQKKLYISYLGGEPFKPRRGVEPWVVQEAEAGNPDAQMFLSSFYRNGIGVPQDVAQAETWLAKAIARGHPRANLEYGNRLVAQHRYAEAASRLRGALDNLPGERYGALLLYVARLHTGEPDLARRELEAAFARDDHDEWPAPVADFYLGKIDAAALVDAAGKDKKLAKARTCTAASLMEALYEARGDKAQAEATRPTQQAHCNTAAQPQPGKEA